MIHFFTGKGVVGKTTLCIQKAHVLANENKKVLLVDLDPHGSLKNAFQIKKLGFKPKKLAPNIDGCLLTPKEALKEYAIQQIKLETLYNLFLDNQMIHFFLEAAPGVSEVALMGKIFYLEQEKKWDDLIIDTPATGHGLYLFQAPKVFLDIAQTGPIAKRSKDLFEMLGKKERSQIHVVCIPEELPVEETIELVQKIATLKLPLGDVIMNKVLPHLETLKSTELSPALKQLKTSPKIEMALLKYKKRIELQKKYIQKLETKLSLKTQKIEHHETSA